MITSSNHPFIFREGLNSYLKKKFEETNKPQNPTEGLAEMLLVLEIGDKLCKG